MGRASHYLVLVPLGSGYAAACDATFELEKATDSYPWQRSALECETDFPDLREALLAKCPPEEVKAWEDEEERQARASQRRHRLWLQKEQKRRAAKLSPLG